MSNSRNKTEKSTLVQRKAVTPKLKKFFPLVAGRTEKSHEIILHKLKSRGAKQVDRGRCHVLLLFCPIVSRLGTDVSSALQQVTGDESRKVIVVAMHHTFNIDYVVPPDTRHRHQGADVPLVHCLFHETTGFLECPRNKDAVSTLRQQMGLKKPGGSCSCMGF